MPYLHFETLRGYEEMVQHISAARNPQPTRFYGRREKRKSKYDSAQAPKNSPPKKISDADDAVAAKPAEAVEINGAKWMNILHWPGQLRFTFKDLKEKLSSKPAQIPKYLGISAIDDKGAENTDLEKGTVKNSGSAIIALRESTPREEKSKQSDSTSMEVTTASREKEIEAEREKRMEAKRDEMEAERVENSTEAEKGINVSADVNSKGEEADTLVKSTIIPDKAQPNTNEEAKPTNIASNVKHASSHRGRSKLTPEAREATKNDSPTAVTTEVIEQGPQSNRGFGVPSGASTFKGKDRLDDIPEENQSRPEDPSGGGGPSSEQPPEPEPRMHRIPSGQLDEMLIKAYSSPTNLGQMPPLQLRRTLDQYFYTDLQNTYQRDTDQVVLR